MHRDNRRVCQRDTARRFCALDDMSDFVDCRLQGVFLLLFCLLCFFRLFSGLDGTRGRFALGGGCLLGGGSFFWCGGELCFGALFGVAFERFLCALLRVFLQLVDDFREREGVDLSSKTPEDLVVWSPLWPIASDLREFDDGPRTASDTSVDHAQ